MTSTILEVEMSVELNFVVDGKAKPAKRYVNPDGSPGGWVSTDAVIGSGVFIHRTSVVGPWGNVEPGAIIGAGTRIGVVPPMAL